MITKPKLSGFFEWALRTWLEDAARAQWRQQQDIKRWHANLSFLAGNRVVLNIHGNAYGLVVAVAYRYAAVYIKFIGTQAQYDAIDAATVAPKP